MTANGSAKKLTRNVKIRVNNDFSTWDMTDILLVRAFCYGARIPRDVERAAHRHNTPKNLTTCSWILTYHEREVRERPKGQVSHRAWWAGAN